jgi:antitoxin (DNA-binding transcriptional repressor) of toxin-antitoxin stability system
LASAFLDSPDTSTTRRDLETKWLAPSEFSANPGRALAAVDRAGGILVTAHGKPKAIMIPTSEATFSRALAMLDRVALTQAVEAIRAGSVMHGTDALTLNEINTEVAAVRAARRRRK